MAVGDLYELTQQLAIASKELSVCFGYEQVAGSDVFNVAEILASNYNTVSITVWRDLLAMDVTLQCTLCRRVAPSPAVPATVNYATAINGTNGQEAVPANSALVAKFVTDNPNAKHNGRKYIPGIADGFLVNGQWSGAFFLAGAWVQWVSFHTSNITAAGPDDQVFEPRVINRVSGGAPIVPPTGSAVTNIVPNTIVYQQRRRTTRRTAEGPV